MSSGLSTNIGIFFLKIISRLPFSVIYLLSDIFYVIVYYIIKYRKKVVVKNLENSFPEKSESEIKLIVKKYFHHFCDLTLETIKMHGMRDDDFRERIVVKNPELVNEYFENHKSIVVLTMHYNNWEWSTALPLYVKHTVLGVYKPLHNRKFNYFINSSRRKMGVELIQNSNVLRRVIKAERSKEPVMVWLAGDQTPPEFHKYWFRFLNQEAMFYPGPAFISKRFNQPILFQKLEKTGRGKYESSFEVLFENPAEVSEAEIINTYIRKMEDVIRANPEFYLWSHKRWKHKRPEGTELLT